MAGAAKTRVTTRAVWAVILAVVAQINSGATIRTRAAPAVVMADKVVAVTTDETPSPNGLKAKIKIRVQVLAHLQATRAQTASLANSAGAK